MGSGGSKTGIAGADEIEMLVGVLVEETFFAVVVDPKKISNFGNVVRELQLT